LKIASLKGSHKVYNYSTRIELIGEGGINFSPTIFYVNIIVIMDPEDKKILEETLDLTRKNHKILVKIRRQQVWARIYRIFYWIVILALAFGLYVWLQPKISKVSALFGKVGEGMENISDLGKNLPKVNDVTKVFNSQ